MSRLTETRSNVFLFILVMLLFYAIWCVWDRTFGPMPVDATRMYAVNPNVQVGDALKVRYEVVRHKICEFESNWTITDSEGKRERVVEPHVNATGYLGFDSFIHSYPLPDDVALGPATLVVVISWSCPENLYEQIAPRPHVNQPISFNVVPRMP